MMISIFEVKFHSFPTNLLLILYKKYNMKDNISWTSFCQAMNSIAYWLVQNQKKIQEA